MIFIGKSLTIFSICVATLQLQAQKIKITEGDLTVLKSEKSINIEFTYDNMSVGKFDKETDFIEKKKGDYNQKEPGKGDIWAKNWIEDRKKRYEPEFIDLFEKNTDMKVNTEAKYTMIFHTSFTEPGYNIYIQRKNADINAEVTIVETANRKKVVAVITIEKAPGRTFGGNDYDTGERISECYAVSGKRLGKLLKD